MATAKKYSRAKDLIIAGAFAFSKGKFNLAAKHLTEAAQEDDFQQTLEDMDAEQQQAAEDQNQDQQDQKQDPQESTAAKAFAKFHKILAAEEQQLLEDEGDDELNLDFQQELDQDPVATAETEGVEVEAPKATEPVVVDDEGTGDVSMSALARAQRAKRNHLRLKGKK